MTKVTSYATSAEISLSTSSEVVNSKYKWTQPTKYLGNHFFVVVIFVFVIFFPP